MNFEEMLESRNGASVRKDTLPFGQLYKKQLDGKYENVVDLRPELSGSLEFCKLLSRESSDCEQLAGASQLHFTVGTGDDGVTCVNVEQGSYHTLESLLDDNPALVMRKGFVSDTIHALLDAAEVLHEHEMYHLCFAPSNVILRRGSNSVSLLFHGSVYTGLHNYRMLYQGYEDYVAPEVLEGERPEPASDVYSLGMLMKYFYQDASLPLELRRVVKKATQADPARRYQSIAAMRKAIKGLRGLKVGLLSLVGAAAVALLCLGIYDTMTPPEEDIEFVTPAPKQPDPDDPLASSLPDNVEMALLDYVRDSLRQAQGRANGDQEGTPSDQELTAKAEEIFRRHFTVEAERILATIYNDNRMDVSEEMFVSANQQAMVDLVKAQMQIAQRAGLNDAKAQRIAGEIIERITNKKKQQLSARRAASVSTQVGTSTTTDPTPSVGGVQGVAPVTGVGTQGTTTTTPTTSTPSLGGSQTTAKPEESRVKRERRREEFERILKENSQVE